MDFAEPLALMDRGFAQLQTSWPQSLVTQMHRLEPRVWPTDGPPKPSLLHRFNTLTKLYPYMQADGVVMCSADQMRSALLAHACLVLFAYITDKADDGQIVFDKEDKRVALRLYTDATQMLGQLKTAGASEFDPRSIFSEIDDDGSVADVGPIEARMVSAADLSARLGFFATLSLLAYAGEQRDTLRSAARAYRHTVIALQYIDDLLDWREDMRIGDNNLLLGAMADRGFQIPEPPSSEWDQLNVAHALLRFDAIDIAVGRARMHLQAAIHIQNALNCTMLCDELESVIRKMDAIVPEVRRRIENEVLVGFLITSTAARQSRS